jgi:hypothetical protein
MRNVVGRYRKVNQAKGKIDPFLFPRPPLLSGRPVRKSARGSPIRSLMCYKDAEVTKAMRKKVRILRRAQTDLIEIRK